MSNTYRSHNFHLVWATKKRQNFLLPKIQEKLFPYMKGVANTMKTHLLEINGTANHVHLLLRLGNLDNYSAIIRNLKTSSSSKLKRDFSECADFQWQDGYGSFCVAVSQLEIVKKYIQNQEAHHAKQTYEDEFIQFLTLNQIDFDPKYIFD